MKKITNVINAQAAIAYLISQGWGIPLADIQKKLPGGIKDQDWLDIAGSCLEFCNNWLAEEKVIPIDLFSRKRTK